MLKMSKASLVEDLVGNAHGNLARVKEILDEHPELLDARAPWNETPIEAAAQMGNREIIDYLLERGAPLDFFTACVLGRRDLVEGELAANPTKAREDGVHGIPALQFAILGGDAAIVRLLVEHGADPRRPIDEKGTLPAQVARDRGRPDLAEIIEKHPQELH